MSPYLFHHVTHFLFFLHSLFPDTVRVSWRADYLSGKLADLGCSFSIPEQVNVLYHPIYRTLSVQT